MQIIKDYQVSFKEDITSNLSAYSVAEAISKIDHFKLRCARDGLTLHRFTDLLIEHLPYGPTPMATLVNELCVLERKKDSPHAWDVSSQLEVLKHAIDAGMDVNQANARGHVPLHYAASSGKRDILAALLDAGAHVNAVDDQGRGALMYYIEAVGESESNHLETFNLLVQKGANLHQKMTDGDCLLSIAVRYGYLKVIKRLLQEGLSVNGTYGHSKDTLLHIAASKYDSSNMRDILAALIPVMDPHRVNAGSETPLHIIAKLNRYHKRDCLQLLLEAGVNLNQMDTEGATALERARENSSAAIISYLEEVSLARKEALELQKIVNSNSTSNGRSSKRDGESQSVDLGAWGSRKIL